ncbi:MAG: DUF4406 domain-containing protein [Treponema sp.]|nr:DUF4406 domain-containing protein [Treponema sp.]
MTVYISGPISGIKDRNKKSFSKAERELKAEFKKAEIEKFKIINPVKIGFKLDEKFKKNNKEPAWEDYMRVCIKELSMSDLVFFLPGWGNSEGAVMEKYIAARLKIPCCMNILEFLHRAIQEVKQ